MSVLHLLEGPAAGALLKKARVYRYTLNKPVFGIAVGFACVCALIVGLLIWKTKLDEAQMIIALAVAGAGAIYYGLRSLYWYTFVKENVLAFTDHVFIVGTKTRVWTLDWSILSVESMGMDKMKLTKMGAFFLVEVAGEKIKVPLYGTMFYLLDLEKLMGDILTRVNNIDATQD